MSYENDDPFIGLEMAAQRFHVSAGTIRELIQDRAIRTKVVRLVEERWLVERYLVSVVDLEQVLSTAPPALIHSRSTVNKGNGPGLSVEPCSV